MPKHLALRRPKLNCEASCRMLTLTKHKRWSTPMAKSQRDESRRPQRAQSHHDRAKRTATPTAEAEGAPARTAAPQGPRHARKSGAQGPTEQQAKPGPHLPFHLAKGPAAPKPRQGATEPNPQRITPPANGQTPLQDHHESRCGNPRSKLSYNCRAIQTTQLLQ